MSIEIAPNRPSAVTRPPTYCGLPRKIARASCIASRVCGKSRHSLRISIPSAVGCTSSAFAMLFTS
jgi:hypothetical protein